jgi:hypothetical protein
MSEKNKLEDEIGKRLSQAQGICALARLYPSASDECPDDALPLAMWAVDDLLSDVEKMVSELVKLDAASPQTQT